jgi:hypothetical protein
MSEAEAILLAEEFLRKKKLDITDLIGAKRHKAARFNALYGYDRYKHDFWVVQFGKPLPPGVVVQDPCCHSIIVEEETSRVLICFPGWE